MHLASNLVNPARQIRQTPLIPNNSHPSLILIHELFLFNANPSKHPTQALSLYYLQF